MKHDSATTLYNTISIGSILALIILITVGYPVQSLLQTHVDLSSPQSAVMSKAGETYIAFFFLLSRCGSLYSNLLLFIPLTDTGVR